MKGVSRSQISILLWIAPLAFIALISTRASAVPMKRETSALKLTVKVTKKDPGKSYLPNPIVGRVLPQLLEWNYLPESALSVPFIGIQLLNIPNDESSSVMVGLAGKIKPDSQYGYLLRIPLLAKQNYIDLSVISPVGTLERWTVEMDVVLSATAIFVDENCLPYRFKIKELKRPLGPNLMFIGCRESTHENELTLDMIWPEAVQVEYGPKFLADGKSIVSIPLSFKSADKKELRGIHQGGTRSVYTLEFEPDPPPPYEVWLGGAFFRTQFSQSNFPASYSGIGSAFMGQVWFRPEGVPLSIMLRGFGTLFNFSGSLSPDLGADSVKTYFVDAELRFRVLDRARWRVEPFVGGWVYFSDVKTRRFGVQRIIDPIMGVAVSKGIFKRDTLGVTLRFVPLQPIFNPAAFSLSQAYFESEWTYQHAFKRRNRWFLSMYYGAMKFQPEEGATTTGSYMVIGGGYGW